MKKLGLKLDTLKVQTFQTVPEIKPRGKVTYEVDVVYLGTRPTRCYAECTVCTMTDCNSNERTEIDCVC